MATKNWCVIYGTPGVDPLTVQGPLGKTEATKIAARAVEDRPDVPAIVDELVGPHAGRPRLKHGSYDAPTHLAAQVRDAAETLDGAMEKLARLDRRRERQVLKETGVADIQRPGSPHDEALLDALIRLRLLTARVRRR